MVYEIVSIDCWNTIITYNPIFWKDFAEKMKSTTDSDLSVDKICIASKKINSALDKKSLKTGKVFDQRYRIKMLLYALKTENKKSISSSVDSIIYEMDKLISNTHRYFSIIDSTAIEKIRLLKPDCTETVLSSNSGFISGHQTSKILVKLGVNFFSRYIYSDEINAAKPDSKFAEHIIGPHKTARTIHIGDDTVTDQIKSTKNNSIESVIIDRKQTLAKVLERLV